MTRYKADQFLFAYIEDVKVETFGEGGGRYDAHVKAWRADCREFNAAGWRNVRAQRVSDRVARLARRWDRKAEVLSIEQEEHIRDFWNARLNAAIERRNVPVEGGAL